MFISLYFLENLRIMMQVIMLILNIMINVTQQLNTIDNYRTIKQFVQILPGFNVYKTRKRVKSS